MIDELDRLAHALQRTGVDDAGSQRLLELAAVATMQAALLDELRDNDLVELLRLAT